MKNFKSMTKFTFAIFAVALFFSSCSKEEMQEVAVKDLVSATHVQQLEAMSFNTENIKVVDFKLPDGTVEKSYLLEGDIALPIAQIEQFLQNEIVKSPEGEQRSLTTLVAAPRLIKILGYTGGGGFGLTTKMRTALSWAVNNYNALPMTINFSLTFGGAANVAGADMVVYQVNGAPGGSAGFPSGGNPYKWVRVNSGSNALSTNFVEGVITHEIGHCLGVVHTDGVTGFIVPGTPALDPNSIFNSFILPGTNGELAPFDRVALNWMY